jgi:hypothetical protein
MRPRLLRRKGFVLGGHRSPGTTVPPSGKLLIASADRDAGNYTLHDAINFYFDQTSDGAIQPSTHQSEYDADRGGRTLQNSNGALPFVRGDGKPVEASTTPRPSSG